MKLSCPYCPQEISIPDYPIRFGLEGFECGHCGNRPELEWDYTEDYDICFWFTARALPLEETG